MGVEVLAGRDAVHQAIGRELGPGEWFTICLLYTSDAADE